MAFPLLLFIQGDVLVQRALVFVLGLLSLQCFVFQTITSQPDIVNFASDLFFSYICFKLLLISVLGLFCYLATVPLKLSHRSVYWSLIAGYSLLLMLCYIPTWNMFASVYCSLVTAIRDLYYLVCQLQAKYSDAAGQLFVYWGLRVLFVRTVFTVLVLVACVWVGNFDATWEKGMYVLRTLLVARWVCIFLYFAYTETGESFAYNLSVGMQDFGYEYMSLGFEQWSTTDLCLDTLVLWPGLSQIFWSNFLLHCENDDGSYPNGIFVEPVCTQARW